MLECTDAIKYFVNGNQQLFQGFVGQMDSIKKLFSVLGIVAIATKKVQDDSFALTDFFGLWLDITMRLKVSPHTEFAAIMTYSLRSRREQLLSHPAMICGVFLDPRFNSELSSEQKNSARLMVNKIWLRLESIKNIQLLDQNETECSLVERYFIEKGQAPTRFESNAPITEHEFNKQLEEYENKMNRIHSGCSIVDFWAGRLEQSKDIVNLDAIKEIAINLVSVPSTQVPVERAFSHLNFVFSKHRSGLEQEILEFIFLIRLNKDLWEDIKTEDRKMLK